MYFIDKHIVMKTSKPLMASQINILERLYAQHLNFHTYLDKVVLNHEDLSNIDVLITVRKMNMECITSYGNLLSGADVYLKKDAPTDFSTFRMPSADMTLWNIHGQLSRLIPIYREALANRNLNQVVRMNIAHSYDKIIQMKENLLHPLPQQVEHA